VANINKPLSGAGHSILPVVTTTSSLPGYLQVHRTLSLSVGLRYEAPETALASLFPVSDAIQATMAGSRVSP